MNQYWVYIMASQSRVIYVGVTNDLPRRFIEHRNRRIPGFTAKYNCVRLVWYDVFTDVNQAIAAEKRIKGWTRVKKIALIEDMNPAWDDLAV